MIKVKQWILATTAMFLSVSAAAETPNAGVTSEKAAYEPMEAFAPFAGKTMRGEWIDEKGGKVVDIAKWEMILGGRALQSTHRIEGSDYGGTSIFFFDEGAEEYVYHYFTTAGFHTQGKAEVDGDVMTAEEKVLGHERIASVRSVAQIKPDEMLVRVVYVGKDGLETPGGERVYAPVKDPGPLFAD